MVKYILRYTRTFGTGSASGRGGSSSTTGLLIVQHRRDLQNREKELTWLGLSTLFSLTGSKDIYCLKHQGVGVINKFVDKFIMGLSVINVSL